MSRAIDRISLPDLRYRRAQALTAAIMQIVEPYLIHEGRSDRDVCRALLDLFHEEGVEVITDAERAAVGLPQRNGHGWTADELIAMEKRRLELLYAPLPPAIVPIGSLKP